MKLINIAIMYGNYIEKQLAEKGDNEGKRILFLTPRELGPGGESSCHKMALHVFFHFWQN